MKFLKKNRCGNFFSVGFRAELKLCSQVEDLIRNLKGQNQMYFLNESKTFSQTLLMPKMGSLKEKEKKQLTEIFKIQLQYVVS